MSDNINHPSHYETAGIECIEAMEITQGREAVKSFCLCNAYRYLWRHKNKNGLEDLKKARWYLDRYITMQTEDDKAIRAEIKEICEDELRRAKELLENRECYIRDLEHELGYDKCIEEVLGDA